MKIVCSILAAIALVVVHAAEPVTTPVLNAPLPSLVLKDGRTLKNVTLVGFAATAVMAKWEGGRGTIAYDLLPADVAEAVKPLRPTPTTNTLPLRKLRLQ